MVWFSIEYDEDEGEYRLIIHLYASQGLVELGGLSHKDIEQLRREADNALK